MSGLAAREVLRRQLKVFGDARFARLATISNGQVYNLRNSATYRAKRTLWTKTRPATAAIGLRQAPQPEGRPGFVRVDTVHQGDRDGVKGPYLINLVDEVTQHEFVGATVGISERFLLPLLEGLLLSFPFPILGFHADNGSEYINHRVARLLDKLRAEFTKFRARRSNDNAPVEGKNASVVRKWFSHDHVPRRFADDVNRFAQGTLSPFLNFHRPCLFATEHRDAKGRIRRKYLARDVMTPYARLRSLADAERFLKPGLGFALLDAVATAIPAHSVGRYAAVKGPLRRPGRLKVLRRILRPTPLDPLAKSQRRQRFPAALDCRSAQNSTLLTNVAGLPNIPHIAPEHPKTNRFTNPAISPSLSHWTTGTSG